MSVNHNRVMSRLRLISSKTGHRLNSERVSYAKSEGDDIGKQLC